MLEKFVNSGFVLWDWLEYEVLISRKSASSRLVPDNSAEECYYEIRRAATAGC